MRYVITPLVISLAVGSGPVAGNGGPAEAAPPAPKEASSEVRLPKPVESIPVRGRASLPPNLHLGFALEIAGEVLTDDWKVTGTVESVEGDTVTIKTDDGKTARLVYRIPAKKTIPIAAGAPLAIERDQHVTDGKIGFNLVIRSGDELILAARRTFSDNPPEAPAEARSFMPARVADKTALRPLRYWTEPNDPKRSENRHAWVFDVPITVRGLNNATLTADDSPVFASFEPSRLKVNDQTLEMTVLKSRYVVPKADRDGLAEPPGYTLEYLIVKPND